MFRIVIWRERRGSRLSQKMRTSEEWEDKSRSRVKRVRQHRIEGTDNRDFYNTQRWTRSKQRQGE